LKVLDEVKEAFKEASQDAGLSAIESLKQHYPAKRRFIVPAISSGLPEDFIISLLDRGGVGKSNYSSMLLEAAVKGYRQVINKIKEYENKFVDDADLAEAIENGATDDVMELLFECLGTFSEADFYKASLEELIKAGKFRLAEALLDKGAKATSDSVLAAIQGGVDVGLIDKLIDSCIAEWEGGPFFSDVVEAAVKQKLPEKLVKKVVGGLGVSSFVRDSCYASAVSNGYSENLLRQMIDKLRGPADESLKALAAKGDRNLIDHLVASKGIAISDSALEAAIASDAPGDFVIWMMDKLQRPAGESLGALKDEAIILRILGQDKGKISSAAREQLESRIKGSMAKTALKGFSAIAALFLVPYAAHCMEYLYRYQKIKRAWRKEHGRIPNRRERKELEAQALKECSFKHDHKVIRIIQVVGSIVGLGVMAKILHPRWQKLSR
jgi:hypothetical protein